MRQAVLCSRLQTTEHLLEDPKNTDSWALPQVPVLSSAARGEGPGNLHFDKLQVMLAFEPYSEQQVLKSLFTFPLYPAACEGTLLPPTSSPKLGAIEVCAV